MSRGRPGPDLARLAALLPPEEPAGLAARLISLPSPNPPGDEGPLAEYLSEMLTSWGMRVVNHPGPTGRPNLIVSLELGPGPGCLILAGHLDVAPPGPLEAWRRDPWRPVVQEGRLYGRGAADMKGGVAALVWGARLLLRAGIELAGRVELHLVSDEEAGGAQGAGHLAGLGLLRGQAALVAEPTNLNLVVGQKGALWSRISIRGRSAHGAAPENGLNAIAMTARLIPALLEQKPAGRHPLLGGGSVNLGRIEGGERVNQVPGLCTLELDQRFVPGDRPQEMEAALEALGQDLARRQGVEVERQRLLLAEPFVTAQDQPIAALALKALEMTGPPARVLGGRGFSDARFYALKAGIPTVVLGPGRLAQAHGPNEYVSLAALTRAALTYASLAALFLDPGRPS